MSQAGVVDSERVDALEAAGEALADDDPRRARVLALLALELHHAGEPERCRALTAQAIEIARAAGDRSELAHTLTNALSAIWVPDALEQRSAMSDELFELAQRLDDPRLSFYAAAWRVLLGLETGDPARAESGLATIRTLAAALPEPSMVFLRLMLESGWALAQGELQAAEQSAIQMFEVGTASGQPDAATTFGAMLLGTRGYQGRSGELVEQLVKLAGEASSPATWRAAAAGSLTESGREDEARALVLAEDFQSVPWDWVWSGTMCSWANVCARLQIADRAGELHELLAPFADRLAVSGVLVTGSIPTVLGTLASILERYEQAEGHFAVAAEIEQRFGAPLLLARTRAGWARTLIARGRTEDRERAAQMLDQAHEVAERLGGGLVTREVAECRAALAAVSG
jgi:ATP/maltotriose-dependent transcriptional regulator MalT